MKVLKYKILLIIHFIYTSLQYHIQIYFPCTKVLRTPPYQSSFLTPIWAQFYKFFSSSETVFLKELS